MTVVCRIKWFWHTLSEARLLRIQRESGSDTGLVNDELIPAEESFFLSTTQPVFHTVLAQSYAGCHEAQSTRAKRRA